MEIECRGPVDLSAIESKYKLFFECALDMVFLIDIDGKILDVNNAVIKEYGYTREELLSMNILNIRAPVVRDSAEGQLKEAFEKGSVYETIHIRKNGSMFSVEISSRGILMEGKKLLLAIVRDMSKRNETMKNTARLAAIAESSSDAVLGLTLEGIITDWNSGAETIYGYTADEMKGRSVEIIMPKDHPGELSQILGVIRQGRSLQHFDTERIRKDGIHIQTSITVSPIKGPDGELLGVSWISRDVTERKRVQEALDERLVALTEPLSTTDVSFTDLFNMGEIQKIQDAFAETMNVASIITYPDGTPITRPSNFRRLCIDIIRKAPKGCENCFRSDAIIGRKNLEGPIIQPCLSGGLWDAGASITVGGKHIANWLIGQVKNEAIDEEKVTLYADEIGVDKAEFKEALREIPVMSIDRFSEIANFLFILAKDLSLKAYQNVQQARFITERKHAESMLEKTNRALRAVSRCNEAMIHIREEIALLHAICGIIVDIGGYRMAWIGYALNDAGKTVQPMAKAGYEHGYIEKVKVTWAEVERGRGPAGTAIRTKKPSVVKNVYASPSFAPWQNEAIKRGYASVISLPLITNNDAFGVLTIYSEKADVFDEGEITLLQELADDLAFGITSIRSRIEREHAEEALLESEERLRLAQQVAHIGTFELNLQTGVNKWTPELETMYALPRGGFPGTQEAWEQLVYPEDRPEAIRRVEEAIEKGDFEGEWRVAWPDGTIHWLYGRGHVFKDRTGRPLRLLGVNIDITERKRAEADLRSARRFQETLISNLPGMVYRCRNDRDWTIEYVSDGCLELTGYKPADLILNRHISFNDLIYPDDQEHLREEIQDAIRMKKPFKSSYRIRTASGQEKWVWEHGRSVPGDKPGDIALEGFITDITERKIAEEELVNAKAQAELYLDLMGHDITNMNQALMGYLELMEVMWESGEIDKRLIDNSIEVINRSSKMIGDVKKLTQLQAGKVSLVDVDVCEMLSEVKTQYEGRSDRPVTINYTPAKECIVSAGGLLKTVFENLVDNAIKHSTGPVTIEIINDRITREGHLYYRITVTDTGPGIPDDLKNKIFMDLKEIGEKTARRGFGLYLVRTLIAYYHGQVWVEDRVPGDYTKGAKFVVVLPAAEK